MMEIKTLKYPIGIQDFEKIIHSHLDYIDKTSYIIDLLNAGKYIFLGRPRRFGKSLLISTLQAFFEGKRGLFHGLAIDSWEEWDWVKYPVIRIDLNAANYLEPRALENRISAQLEKYENQLELKITEGYSISDRFHGLIRQTFLKTGRQAVVLIDEYDKPILDTLHSKEAADKLRDILRAFYSVLKSNDEYLKFSFLTGITKFGQLNIFSGLNNLQDISLLPAFAGICGITEEELHQNFESGVNACAREWECSTEDVYRELKNNYDGYHFSKNSPDIYNPWSLLNALAQKDIRSYWNASGGSASFIYKMIAANKLPIYDLAGLKCTADTLYGVGADMDSPVSILYQSGYLTIKNHTSRLGRITYELGYPNKEVEDGFLTGMLAFYARETTESSSFAIHNFVNDILNGNCNAFLSRINSFFADFPYENALEIEQHFQNVMYCIIKLLGLEVDIEYHTSDGRIDMLIRTSGYIYVIEFKRDQPADVALKQIEEKRYAEAFAPDRRKLILAGVTFSTKERRITDYKISES